MVVCALTWGDFSKMFQKRNFWHILHEGTILSNASTLIFRFSSLNLRRAFFFSPSPDFELPRSWLFCFSRDSTLFSSFEIFSFKSYNIISSSLRYEMSEQPSRGSTSVARLIRHYIWKLSCKNQHGWISGQVRYLFCYQQAESLPCACWLWAWARSAWAAFRLI